MMRKRTVTVCRPGHCQSPGLAALGLAVFFTLGVGLENGVWARPADPAADGGPALTSPVGNGPETPKVGDPLSAADGTYREEWPLFRLGGPLDLGLTLLYAPDLQYKSPWNNGRTQMPPAFTNAAFTTDSVLRMVEVRKKDAAGNPVYANVFLSDDTVAFRREESGAYTVVGPVGYQLQRVGDDYFFLDPVLERVIVFRSAEYNWTFLPMEDVLRGGEALAVYDRNGNALRFTYNADNNPTFIEDGLGRSLTLEYRSGEYTQRHLSRVSDDTGRQVSFSFQSMSCPTETYEVLDSFADALGRTTRFEYYPTGSCTLVRRVIRPTGNVPVDQVWGPNAQGYRGVVTQTDAAGNVTNLTYTDEGSGLAQTSALAPDGSGRAYHCREGRFLAGLTDEAGQSLSVAYNAASQPTGLTDRTGAASTLGYHAPSGKPLSATNAAGQTLSYTYEEREQTFSHPAKASSAVFTFYDLARVDYPDGVYEAFTRDAHGNVLTRRDRTGATWSYTYNARGQVLTATTPTGGVTTYTYHPDGALATEQGNDPGSGVTAYGYDACRRLNKVTHPGGSFLTIAYDAADQVTQVTDELSRITTYTWDLNGNLAAVSDSAGTTTYSYDLMDRVTGVIDRLSRLSQRSYDSRGRLASTTDPTGVVTTFGYDPRGTGEDPYQSWLTAVTRDGSTWRAAYTPEGWVEQRSDPLDYVTRYAYDPLGELVEVRNPLGELTKLTRDACSRLTVVTDPLGRSRQLAYDGEDRLTGLTLSGLGSVTYERNPRGDLERITDFRGNPWDFTHSGLGLLQAVQDPLARNTVFGYDSRDRLMQTGFPGGGVLLRHYDDAGNLLSLTATGGPSLIYSYDALNRLVSAEGLSLTRDAEGRVTASQNGAVTFGATYDAAGRVQTVTYGNGELTATYVYDAATGLLSGVSDDRSGASVSLTYDANFRLTALTRSNGVVSTIAWDPAGRIQGISHGDFVAVDCTYDAAGQLSAQEVEAPFATPVRLGLAESTYSYDEACQLNSPGFGYDSRGRQTAAPGVNYTWDGASRLIGIGAEALTYNGLNDVISRTSGGLLTRFFYNYALPAAPVAAEKQDPPGLVNRVYVWAPDGALLYLVDAAAGYQPYYYHFDATGHTLALTDAAGAVTDAYAYTPYGIISGHTGTNSQPFTFGGQGGVRQEGETGLYQMRVRYYDANTARFLSPDPLWPILEDPQQLNPYPFAAGDPLRRFDFTGTIAPEDFLDQLAAAVQQAPTPGAFLLDLPGIGAVPFASHRKPALLGGLNQGSAYSTLPADGIGLGSPYSTVVGHLGKAETPKKVVTTPPKYRGQRKPLPKTLFVKAKTAKLRRDPSLQRGDDLELGRGTKLDVLGKKKGWYKVAYRGKIGWVYEGKVSTEKPVDDKTLEAGGVNPLIGAEIAAGSAITG